MNTDDHSNNKNAEISQVDNNQISLLIVWFRSSKCSDKLAQTLDRISNSIRYPAALPPSSASSRERSGETRTSSQQMGKWPKSGNAGWGPPADSFSTGDPALRDQSISSCSPTAQWQRRDNSTWPTTEASLVQCTGSVPRHATTPDPESALSHSLSIPALLRHQGPLCPCSPLPLPSHIYSSLRLSFWAAGRSSGDFSGCLETKRIERALIDLVQEF